MANYTVFIDTFLFRRSWSYAFKSLTDEEAGKLIKAIYKFTEGSTVKLDKPELSIAYDMIVTQLNDSACRYADKIGLSYDTE